MKYSSDSQSEEKPNNNAKLERPRSLSIHPNEEPIEETTNDINTKEKAVLEEQIEEVQNEIDSIKLNGQPKEISADVTSETAVEDEKLGRKTPSHLTEQGYFDLKFYHNKLW